MAVIDDLFGLQDVSYRDFHSKLIPTVEKQRIIGVRTPALRAYAKKIANTPLAAEFMAEKEHYYFEENNLHGALIEYGKYDFKTTIILIEDFLPRIDNWATCDMFVPSIFKRNKQDVYLYIQRWIKSEHPYTVRFAVNCLMRDFLDASFSPTHFDRINKIDASDYYVKMGIAWYYSFAFIKQWDATVAMFEKGLPDAWIQNKAIQKARESFRLTPEQKNELLRLKIKR